jgi:hypothetical protein
MIELHDKETGALVAVIGEAELALLVEGLEEEDSDDKDYYIDATTLHLLAEVGFDKDILQTIGHALGDREGMDVVWSRRAG